MSIFDEEVANFKSAYNEPCEKCGRSISSVEVKYFIQKLDTKKIICSVCDSNENKHDSCI